jgi:hypothetical protein
MLLKNSLGWTVRRDSPKYSAISLKRMEKKHMTSFQLAHHLVIAILKSPPNNQIPSSQQLLSQKIYHINKTIQKHFD